MPESVTFAQLYVVSWEHRAKERGRPALREQWVTLARHRGEAFAWLLMAKPHVDPQTVEITPYGT